METKTAAKGAAPAAKGAAPAAAGKDAAAPAPALEKVDKAVSADLLKSAGVIPSGVEDFDPMENIPTVRVGQDFAAGMTIGGWYEETQELASHKFTKSKTRNAAGVPTSFRHVLRIGSPTGERLAIWSTGELKNTFAKLNPGEYIAITYKDKGLNAANNEQHFFEYKRGAQN